MNSSEIQYGDIIVESVTFPEGEYAEIARYLIVGKYIEEICDEPYQLESREVVYFKTIVLYIGREHDSVWARNTNPGTRYLLSEHEITNYHDWDYCYKSDLNWPIDSIEVEQSGASWDEPGY